VQHRVGQVVRVLGALKAANKWLSKTDLLVDEAELNIKKERLVKLLKLMASKFCNIEREPLIRVDNTENARKYKIAQAGEQLLLRTIPQEEREKAGLEFESE